MSDDLVLVCSTVGFFRDDVHGECADCGGDIVWRPHTPADARRICIACFVAHTRTLPRAEQERMEVGVLPETLDEIAALAKRRLF